MMKLQKHIEKTMSRSFWLALTAVLILTGCVAPPPAPVVEEPVQVVKQPQPAPQNQEILKALSQLVEIKDELKLLRNSVEELQFESENSKRRLQDLYQDIDRRLVDIERNQRVISPATQIAVGEGESDQGDEEEWGIPGSESPTGIADSTAAQVLVVEGPNQGSNEGSGETTEPDSGSGASSSAADSGTVSLEEQNAYDQAFELLKQSRYEDLIQAFQQFVGIWPNSQLADDAYYWMAEARYVNREFEQALSDFRTVVRRYPDSQRVPEALLKTGYIQYDIGAYEEAAEIFRDILARFPGHQVTVSAQTRLQRIQTTIQ